MRIEAKNQEFDATPANTVLIIGETLLNSIYTDMGEDYYVIPAMPTSGYIQLAVALHNEGIPTLRVDEYDPNAEPFVYVINGLCRSFRNELDYLQVGDEG